MTVGALTAYMMTIQEAIFYVKYDDASDDKQQVLDDIIDAFSALKNGLSGTKTNFDSMITIFVNAKETFSLPDNVLDIFQKWCEETVNNALPTAPPPLQVKCDEDFNQLILKLEQCNINQLLAEASKSVEKYIDGNKDYYDLLLHWYRAWYRIDTFKYSDPSFVRYFGSLYTYLKNNTTRLSSFYNELCDYRSRFSLMIVLQHWLTFTPDLRFNGIEHTFPHYYDLDLISCSSNEVFVDCGAYTGDSIVDFLKMYGKKYKRIYAYELTPKTYRKLEHNLKDYKNIICRNAGVTDKNGYMSMLDMEGSEAGNRLVQEGGIMMPIVSLDNDISEDISFIKMDIEGAEIAALHGAKNHIRRSHPKLAISLYHAINHLLDIPELIRKIDPSYKFYFRNTGGAVQIKGVPFPTEYILIAI